MMRRNSLHAGTIGAMVVMFCAVSAQATVPAVTYTDLYTLGRPAGFGYTDVTIGDHTTAGGQVVGYGLATGDSDHALLWTPSTPDGIDLNPAGYTYSHAVGTSLGAPGQQVGQGYGSATGNNTHALLWNGSAASAVDLNPTGFSGSRAFATNGTQQVGEGDGHALLWNGSAASAVDLNPAGFVESVAYGTSPGAPGQQVGWGFGPATGDASHALLWTGSAGSYVDLNPIGFHTSQASGVSSTQQVGYGMVATGNPQAMLWNGSAASFVDLNPDGFDASYANATNGMLQVGYGIGPAPANIWHALLWSGSADNYVDLGALLPASSDYPNSYALSIDGDTIYGLAVDTSGEYYQAIEWNIVPEPGSFGLVGLAMLAFAGRRRRRQGFRI